MESNIATYDEINENNNEVLANQKNNIKRNLNEIVQEKLSNILNNI
jgi:hypothetical protein